ncbi:cytochrome b [Sphingomonas hylomeconis]|uniref:Cytochrome b n=1 Tax=Sphingomonas hylomeconis TaxID=1395958 RepID=A0ABV7STU6_9SPHN|nr:cytochrome b [Sphingomonas hylomeconis]
MSAQVERYNRVAIWFHWSIALLVLANLALGLLHESLFEGLRWVMPIHKSIGLTVLALTLGRIAWRLTHRAPAHPSTMPAWERTAAGTTHFLFYVLMLALPLSGWAMVSGSAKRRPLDFFGLFDVPYLPVGPSVGSAAGNAHGLLGWVMLALVLLHVGAALRHHFLLRDGVLAGMVPGLAPRR